MRGGRPDRPESGTTLIELVITVAIMGFAMLALMGGIGTSIIFADVQRQDASVGLVLASAAERIASEDMNRYTVCATATTYDPGLSPVGFDVRVTAVALWDIPSNRFVPRQPPPPEPPPPSCSATPPRDEGLQLLTITATAINTRRGDQVEVLEVVKRQVNA